MAGAANTSATPSAPRTDPLTLTEPPSEKWLSSGARTYSVRAQNALRARPPRTHLVRCAPQPAAPRGYATDVRQGIGIGLCALALTLVTATPARAGDYTVHSCKEEIGTPVYPTDGWKAIGRVNAETVGDGCFRGGSLFAQLPAA